MTQESCEPRDCEEPEKRSYDLFEDGEVPKTMEGRYTIVPLPFTLLPRHLEKMS